MIWFCFGACEVSVLELVEFGSVLKFLFWRFCGVFVDFGILWSFCEFCKCKFGILDFGV